MEREEKNGEKYKLQDRINKLKNKNEIPRLPIGESQTIEELEKRFAKSKSKSK